MRTALHARQGTHDHANCTASTLGPPFGNWLQHFQLLFPDGFLRQNFLLSMKLQLFRDSTLSHPIE